MEYRTEKSGLYYVKALSQDKGEVEVLWQILGRKARCCDLIYAIFQGPIFKTKFNFEAQ